MNENEVVFEEFRGNDFYKTDSKIDPIHFVKSFAVFLYYNNTTRRDPQETCFETRVSGNRVLKNNVSIPVQRLYG